MKMFCLLVIVALLFAGAFASQGFADCMDSFVSTTIPSTVSDHANICRDGKLAISYDVDMVNPAWSAYHITPDDLRHVVPGRDKFYEDPDLETMQITQAPVYSKAFHDGFNRGHLAPSHIMSASTDSKDACYTMANIAPQNEQFNGGAWNDLEMKVFDWVTKNDALHIMTGVLYKDRRYPKRRADNIAQPDYYFKVICDAANGQSAGFYGENQEGGYGTSTFRTVREVELMFGGKLFPDVCNTHKVDSSYWWGDDNVNYNATKLRK